MPWSLQLIAGISVSFLPKKLNAIKQVIHLLQFFVLAVWAGLSWIHSSGLDGAYVGECHQLPH